MFGTLLALFKEGLHGVAQRVQDVIKSWLTPQSQSPVLGAIGDIIRSRPDLIVENALLLQQLIVLKRQIKRPQYIVGSLANGLADEPLAELATGDSARSARHGAALASRAVQALLVGQIPAYWWQTRIGCGRGDADQTDGVGESVVGRGADTRRTAQARYPRQQDHDPEVFAERSCSSFRPDMADICA